MSSVRVDPSRAVPHVGTYRRELPVSLERLYENALDWEHLPWLHRTTFSSVDLLDRGESSWRARVGLQRPTRERVIVLELTLDRERHRWISSTLEGPGAGTEIWTHAFSMEERRTEVVVDFFVPDVAPESRERVAAYLEELYTRLYDEDAWMMTERQTQLDARRLDGSESDETLDLGPLDEVRPRLPIIVESRNRSYRIVEVEGDLIAHATVCPHMLGPLVDAEVCDGVVECPWHGYRYDVRTGENAGDAPYRLAPAPEVRVDPVTNRVSIGWPDRV